MFLREIKGSGYLDDCNGNRVNCSFIIRQLANGMIEAEITIDQPQISFNEQAVERLVGRDHDNNIVEATEILILETTLANNNIYYGHIDTLVHAAHQEITTDTVHLKFEATNYRLHDLQQPIQFRHKGYEIEILRSEWNQQQHRFHRASFKYAAVTTEIRLRNVPSAKQEEAIRYATEIQALLSIACRSRVFIVSHSVFDNNQNWTATYYMQPIYTDQGWSYPLIPNTAIVGFIQQSYDNFLSNFVDLELATAIEHYHQALSIRSVWSIATGMFTALETIKTAFLRPSERHSISFWVESDADFKRQSIMFNELVDVLASYFDRFKQMNRAERDSLSAQFYGLNRRSYKSQLVYILDYFKVSYDKRELQSIITIRNLIIHEGSPNSQKEYEENEILVRSHWGTIKRSVTLFEKLLLAILGYHGARDEFDQTF